MRILVIEDEKKLAGFIKRALKEDGHAVDLCHDGDEGMVLVRDEAYDAIVLDLVLPGRDGISILKDLRERKKATPVIILSGRDTVKDRVRGLDAGADDYLVKPFALDELRARVRRLLRYGQTGEPTMLRFADITMNLLERVVMRGKREIPLTAKEFSLLEYFLHNPNRVLTRTSIAEHVWDYNFDWRSNVVDVFVNSVRRKLEEEGEPRVLFTVRSVGYALRETAEMVE